MVQVANLSSPAGDVVVGDKYKAVFTITGGSVRFYFGTSANTAKNKLEQVHIH